jgi:hypothetical protein
LSLVVVEKDLPDMVGLSIGNGEFAGELTATNFAFLYECLDLLPAATFLLDDFEVTGDTTLTALLRLKSGSVFHQQKFASHQQQI